VTVYAWPTAWKPSRFELRILPNVRTFVGPYTPTTQILDFLGERWTARIDLPITTDNIEIAAREAFFDRLKGPANQVGLWHFDNTLPQGTMTSGSPVLAGAVAQLANTCSISGAPVNSTLKAGDMLGINGQLVRVMADATADGSGVFASVEFQPRARVAWSGGLAVTYNKPTANFMLKSDGVPISRIPDGTDAVSFEMIEAL
jgi:hypothetical protein